MEPGVKIRGDEANPHVCETSGADVNSSIKGCERSVSVRKIIVSALKATVESNYLVRKQASKIC